ncbi:MAG: hypothetical protein ACTSX0_08450, partial [Promethearchaeota archaeon]
SSHSSISHPILQAGHTDDSTYGNRFNHFFSFFFHVIFFLIKTDYRPKSWEKSPRINKGKKRKHLNSRSFSIFVRKEIIMGEKNQYYHWNLNYLKKKPSIKEFHQNSPLITELDIWESKPVSFKNLPEKLPNLKKIDFHNSIIHNFQDLTADMPKLKSFYFDKCHIRNFRGIPKNTVISIQRSTIDSFSGIKLPIPNSENDSMIGLDTSIIRSLSETSKTTLQAILYEIFTHNRIYYYKNKYYKFDPTQKRLIELKKIEYNPDKNAYYDLHANQNVYSIFDFDKMKLVKILQPQHPKISQFQTQILQPKQLMKKLEKISIENHITNYFKPIFLNIPPHAMELIEATLNPNPDPDIINDNIIREIITTEHEMEFEDLEDYCREYGVRYNPDIWFEEEHSMIFPPDFIIAENLDRLYEYYKKSPEQLAAEYIADSKSLPAEEIERLIHETDPTLRKLLENSLPHSDSIIKDIAAKFAFQTQNGLKILK